MAKPGHVVGTESAQGGMLHLSGTSLTLLHQAAQQAGVFDLVFVWVTNAHATDTEHVDIYWAGDTDPACKVPVNVLPRVGPMLVIPGWPLERGLTVKAQAATGAVTSCTTVVSPISVYQ